MKLLVRAATSAAAAMSKRGGNSGPGSRYIRSNSGRLRVHQGFHSGESGFGGDDDGTGCVTEVGPPISGAFRVPIPVEFGRTPVVGSGDQCGRGAGSSER